jgi:hypothetical protein
MSVSKDLSLSVPGGCEIGRHTVGRGDEIAVVAGGRSVSQRRAVPPPNWPCALIERRIALSITFHSAVRYLALRPPRHLFKASDHHLSFRPRQPVDPELAVDLIDLVLVATARRAADTSV